MSGRIADETIAEIRDRTDIVEVVGRYVQLRRSGTNHKGLCPFHEEKTPSFNVSSARQFFHCFGCQASGDVFAFLMRMEGRAFVEVVEDLARTAGVEIPRERLSLEQVEAERSKRSERQRAAELNARVARFYQRCLASSQGEPAQRYLAERGIDEMTSEGFMLGFAPRSAAQLTNNLRAKRIDLEFAARVGLVARRGDGTYHDRFWNRLICPIVSPGGEVVGFGGRLLGDGSGPKYVNTPETPLFHKGELLYGLHRAVAGIRKAGQALLVEGNFDVLQLHRHGFDNAVAPLGTALTAQQARLIARFAPRVVAIFDGDRAGRAAAQKSVKTLIEAGLEAKIASLPDGADPDSLLAQQGAEAMRRVVDSAVPAIDYLIEELRGTTDKTIPGRAHLLEQVAPLVRRLSSTTAQALYVDRLTLEFGLQRQTVQNALVGNPAAERDAVGAKHAAHHGAKRPPSAADSARSERFAAAGAASADGAASGGKVKVASSPSPRIDPRELELLKLLVTHPRLVSRAERAHLAILLSDDALRSIYATAVQMQREKGDLNPVELMRGVPDELRDAVALAAMSHEYAADGDPTRALDDCVAALASSHVARIVRRVQQRIARAQGQAGQVAFDSRAEMKRLDVLTKIQSRIKKARDRHEAEQVWSLVPELVEVEREIHETQ